MVEAYAAAAEPIRHENFMEAWAEYLEHCLDQADRDRLADLDEEELYSHFRRAHKIFNGLDRSASSTRQASELVHSVAGIGIVVSGDGKILASNEFAKPLVGEAKFISQLSLDDTSKNHIQGWVSGRNADHDGFMFTPYLERDNDGFLLITEFSAPMEAIEEGGASVVPEKRFLISSVEMRLDEQALKESAKAFELTKAEMRIAGDLCEGLRTAEIAETRFISNNTVRTHVKSIQRKTNSHSRLDVVRKLYGFAATLREKERKHSEVNGENKGAWRRYDSLTLRDGRQLSYCDQGDLEGRPILFFHNMSFGLEWTDSAVEACARRGFRIISPSRPGFGATDGHAAAIKDELLDLAVADAAQLLEYLEIPSALVVGHVMGSIYAQRFAARYADNCDGLLFVSHAPYWSDELAAKLPKHQRMLANTALHAPFALSLILRAGAALIDSGHEDMLIRASHQQIPADRLALKNAEVKRVVQQGLRHAAQQGIDAFAKDCHQVTADWHEDTRELGCSVNIIYGDGDQIVRPDHIEAYLRAVPSAGATCIKDAGQYLLYSHWSEVLSEIEAMLPDR